MSIYILLCLTFACLVGGVWTATEAVIRRETIDGKTVAAFWDGFLLLLSLVVAAVIFGLAYKSSTGHD